MADANELSIRIGADPSKLNQGLRQSSAAIDSFGSKAKATLTRVGTSLKGAADKMLTPFNALLLGGGVGVAVKSVGDLSQSLMYYGMAAKKSEKETAIFRENLHKMAIQTGVDAKDILAGISKIGEVTGEFGFSEDMGIVLAKAAKASGASVDELASVASSMKVSMGWGAEQISQAFNALIIEGDQGSYTLQKFAGEGKALLAAASSFGIKSQEQFANFGAYLQIMNTSIKSEAELTTSVSALFSELISKQKNLQKIGVRVFDKKGEIRNFDDIMRELMAKTDGNIKKISPLFGDSARKALVPVMAEYKNGFKTLEAISNSGSQGMKGTDALEERYRKTANDFNTNIAKMKSAAMQFADSNLVGPVNALSNALKTLSEHQGLVKAGFVAMTAAASALVAVKIGGFIKEFGTFASDIKNIWSKKAAGGVDADGAAAAAMGAVQKVFVVNMAPGMGGMAGQNAPGNVAKEMQKTATTVATAQKQIGGFGQAVSTARGGLNKFGNTLGGGALLSVATGWAIGQIHEFGSAFMEWRKTVNDVRQNSEQYLRGGEDKFTERYGEQAGYYNKKINDVTLEIQKETTSWFTSDKNLEKLYAKQEKYRELMKQAIKEDMKPRVSAQEYMQALNQTINIRVDPQNQRAIVETNAGKPPKVQSTVPFT